LGKNQTFVPIKIFGFGFLVLGLDFVIGYKKFWVLGLGLGIIPNPIPDFYYNTQNPILSGYKRLERIENIKYLNTVKY